MKMLEGFLFDWTAGFYMPSNVVNSFYSKQSQQQMLFKKVSLDRAASGHDMVL